MIFVAAGICSHVGTVSRAVPAAIPQGTFRSATYSMRTRLPATAMRLPVLEPGAVNGNG